MTGRTLSRHFHSSNLIRLLSDTTLLDTGAPRQDFAERLGLWLSAVDTVRLHAALQPGPTVATAQPRVARQAATLAAEQALEQVRSQLVKAIVAHDAALHSGLDDPTGGFAPYRKRHHDQQRQMESKIAPLRAQLRQVAAKASSQLRQLATLDAVLEQALGGREQKLLAMVPVFLEKRFEQLRRAHESGLNEAAPLGKPAPWLDAFGNEWQAVLLAELDIRLQPVMGLVDALHNEIETHA